MNPQDYFKNDINVGDIVAYPGRGGSSMWMNHARVLEVVTKPRYSWQTPPCDMVTKLKVEPLDMDMKTCAGTRTSTLECFDRMINLSVPLQTN
jgi:hypothetical protein